MKQKNNRETLDNFASSFKKIFESKHREILIFSLSLIVVTILNFFGVATTQTISSFRITEFEVGQIADRTIVANMSLPPDSENPVSVADGEKVIKKGFPITEEQFLKLKKIVHSPNYFDVRYFANREIFIVLLAFIWLFLFMFLPFGRKVKMSEIILQIVFFCLVFVSASLVQKIDLFSKPHTLPVMLPSSIFVFLLTILYGQLPAVIFSFVSSLGVFCAANWEPRIFLFVLLSSLAAVWIVRKIERRIDMIVASLVLAILNYVILLSIAVIFNDDVVHLFAGSIGVALNGLISGIFALGLLTPVELLLNTASVFRLMDLSDLNAPELRKMFVNASGTYNHTMLVAQLAENACCEIGANALVARVGAYYHDIGKIEQSEYFIENQGGGVNKHDFINPTLSISIIKSHLKKGIERAKQLHLPEQVIEVIGQHHGNDVIEFFYRKAKEKDSSVEPEDCSYPGIPPRSKEAGVVMLADIVEAACRTLANPSVSRLEQFIQGLIDKKIAHKQLDNCALTFGEIAKIKAAFVRTLAAYYHSRIKYPDQKDPDDMQNKAKPAEKDNAADAKKTEAKSENKQEEQKDGEAAEGKSKSESAKSDSSAGEKPVEQKSDSVTEEKSAEQNASDSDTKNSGEGQASSEENSSEASEEAGSEKKSARKKNKKRQKQGDNSMEENGGDENPAEESSESASAEKEAASGQ